MHEFLHFYLFIFFPGVYTSSVLIGFYTAFLPRESPIKYFLLLFFIIPSVIPSEHSPGNICFTLKFSKKASRIIEVHT